jgi:hypothetical protein
MSKRGLRRRNKGEETLAVHCSQLQRFAQHDFEAWRMIELRRIDEARNMRHFYIRPVSSI